MKLATIITVIGLFGLAACGGSETRIDFNGSDGAEVMPGSPEYPASPAPDDAADTVIVPSHEETPPEQDEVVTPGGETATPTDTTPDATVSNFHLNPAVVAHLIGSNNGSSATINAFKVEKSEAVDNFTTLKVSYDFTGGKKAYIFGNIFNRLDLEPAADKCDVSEDGRFLVVNEDGTKLNEGSADFEKWSYLVRGKLCGAGDPSAENDCVETQDAWDEGTQDPQIQYPLQTNPHCRMDLIKNASVSTSDVFYTRSLARYGKACLAVQGADDQWTVQCRRMDAPQVEIDIEKMEVSKEGPYVDVKLSYARATKEPSLAVDGDKSTCDLMTHDFTAKNGAGRQTYHCDITNGNIDLTLKAVGVGGEPSNVLRHRYHVRLGVLKLTFDYKDPNPGHGMDIASTVEFKWSVSRDYAITDESGDDIVTGDTHTTFWAKEVRFFGGSIGGITANDLKETVAITADRHEGTIAMPRNHDVESWVAEVFYYTSPNPVVSDRLKWGYDYDVQFNPNGTDIPGGMDATSAQHCNHTPNLQIWMEVPWRGHGVSNITSSDCVVESVNPAAGVSLDGYGLQSGTVKVHRDFGPQNGLWAQDLTCHFKVAYADGSHAERPFTMSGPNCHP